MKRNKSNRQITIDENELVSLIETIVNRKLRKVLNERIYNSEYPGSDSEEDSEEYIDYETVSDNDSEYPGSDYEDGSEEFEYLDSDYEDGSEEENSEDEEDFEYLDSDYEDGSEEEVPPIPYYKSKDDSDYEEDSEA